MKRQRQLDTDSMIVQLVKQSEEAADLTKLFPFMHKEQFAKDQKEVMDNLEKRKNIRKKKN